MKLKKIIIFYPSFERGGVEKILVNLINFFLKKNYNILLISSNFNSNLILNKKNFKLIEPKYKKSFFINSRISKSLSAFNKLKAILKNCKKEESIIFSLQSSTLAIIISKILSFKIVVRNAENPIYSTIYAENKIVSYFVLILKMFFYNFANGIISNSKGSEKSLRKILFNKNIKTIYNPYIKKILKRRNNKKLNYILAAGRLTKQKDFKTLILAFNKIKYDLKEYKLIILGDGELKKSLKDLIVDLKISSRVKLMGWINNLEFFYKNSKLFVLSSLYEGLGNVLLDAINYDIPIVTTNCKSGPSEIINYGKGGYLSPVSNTNVLSQKILYALRNYKLSKKKSRYAKIKLHRFLEEKNSSNYLDFIKKIFYEK
tara:strand:- start:5986 stop:7104 length:1119 start_codon:yes stop_codon:yes gene_type:complete